jgi:hypothetical protein
VKSNNKRSELQLVLALTCGFFLIPIILFVWVGPSRATLPLFAWASAIDVVVAWAAVSLALRWQRHRQHP